LEARSEGELFVVLDVEEAVVVVVVVEVDVEVDVVMTESVGRFLW